MAEKSISSEVREHLKRMWRMRFGKLICVPAISFAGLWGFALGAFYLNKITSTTTDTGTHPGIPQVGETISAAWFPGVALVALLVSCVMLISVIFSWVAAGQDDQKTPVGTSEPVVVMAGAARRYGVPPGKAWRFPTPFHRLLIGKAIVGAVWGAIFLLVVFRIYAIPHGWYSVLVCSLMTGFITAVHPIGYPAGGLRLRISDPMWAGRSLEQGKAGGLVLQVPVTLEPMERMEAADFAFLFAGKVIPADPPLRFIPIWKEKRIVSFPIDPADLSGEMLLASLRAKANGRSVYSNDVTVSPPPSGLGTAAPQKR